MGGRSSRRNQLDPQQDVIYQDLNHRVLISSGNQKPLPTATVPSTPQLHTDVYVHRNSITLDPDPSQPSLLWLEFQFDSKCPCLVTIFFYATEVLDAAWVTRDYTSDSPHSQPKRTFDFDAGLGQKFNSDLDSFYVEDIFGLKNTEENECVVCMTDKKDTSVLPCRHLCLCAKCAHTMRSQKQPKCPICRTNVVKLLQIKDG